MENLPSASPSIPMRTSLRPVPTAHRPSSRPTSSSIDHAHPASGRVKAQPASPEVISSLISSLSAISAPAEDHFKKILNDENTSSTYTPSTKAITSPVKRDRSRSRSPGSSTKHGFGMDYGAYKTANDAGTGSLLHPDDAAIAPVVRLAKMPVSAMYSRPISLEQSPGKLTLRRSRSSLNSDHNSIGMLSSEPGPTVSPPTGALSNSGKKRSSRKLVKKNSLELMKKRSVDFFSDRSARRSNAQGLGGAGQGPAAGLNLSGSTANLAEEPEDTGLDGTSQIKETASQDPSPERVSASPAMDTTDGSYGVSSGRFIPTRESSLRHSYGGSPSTKKRRSGRHSRYSSVGSKDVTIGQDLVEDKTEEDQTVRRIEELKAQKRRRDDEIRNEERAGRTKSKSPGPTPVSLQPVPSVSDVWPTIDVVTGPSGVMDKPKEIGESAPAPLVLTHKSTANRHASGPLSPKVGNVQTPEKLPGDQGPRRTPRLKQGSRPVTPKSLDQHQRTFSNPRSPNPRSLSGNEERPSSADSVDAAVDAFLSSPRLTQRIVHPHTGRVIAFSEVGDSKGHAVICCVGMGLTRYLTAFYDELAWTLKLRLITPDRPGVGESQACTDGSGTPLSWPDDVTLICSHLAITKFSVLAHSAGAIYALATALRMPQQIRGRLHLMAPWIPPSQMTDIGSHREPLPANALPYSQRILRALPTPFLKAANSSFMSATSASLTSSLPRSPRKTKRRSFGKDTMLLGGPVTTGGPDANAGPHRASSFAPGTSPEGRLPSDVSVKAGTDSLAKSETAIIAPATSIVLDHERQSDYDNRLTTGIWELATTNANPAVDLLICLERRQPIGFRYVDITRAIVIHHGSRDTRVPVENVKWLGKTMRRCEVRILEGEGHGLMASAAVMGNILMEMAKEWEDWNLIVQGKKEGKRHAAKERLNDLGR